MTIYEIDEKILSLIDPVTGELKDYEAFAELQMAREQKAENVALWIKDLTAEAKAIKEEEDKLATRRKSAENKVASLKRFLGMMLDGEKFKTARVSVSYRNTPSVEVDEDFIAIAEGDPALERFLDYKNPTVKKTELKDALTAGESIPHARIVYNTSIQIR